MDNNKKLYKTKSISNIKTNEQVLSKDRHSESVLLRAALFNDKDNSIIKPDKFQQFLAVINILNRNEEKFFEFINSEAEIRKNKELLEVIENAKNGIYIEGNTTFRFRD